MKLFKAAPGKKKSGAALNNLLFITHVSKVYEVLVEELVFWAYHNE